MSWGGSRGPGHVFFREPKGIWGLTAQCITAPNGMVVEVMIDTMRLNDNILHSKTKVNERLAALQDNNDFQGLIWGDAIYPNRGHTVKTSGNEDVDKAMRGCRNSIEHTLFQNSKSPFWVVEGERR